MMCISRINLPANTSGKHWVQLTKILGICALWIKSKYANQLRLDCSSANSTCMAKHFLLSTRDAVFGFRALLFIYLVFLWLRSLEACVHQARLCLSLIYIIVGLFLEKLWYETVKAKVEDTWWPWKQIILELYVRSNMFTMRVDS